MKTYKYITMAAAALLLLAGCQKKEFRTVYPAGDPQVTAKMQTTDVEYGRDSIYFTVSVSETETPLSTLSVKVMVGSRLLQSQTIRTKDYYWEGTLSYFIPFGANMAEGDPVRVYLTATNVEGTTKDVILSDCVGHRPAMETMYIMPPTVSYAAIGKGKQMTDEGERFAAYDLGFPKSFECLLAVVGNKFGRVDWNYPVFGMLNGELAMITKAQFESGEATSITLANDAYETIDTVFFNPLSFELSFSGKVAQPISALNVETDLEEPSYITASAARKLYRGAKLYFDKDSEVEITGCRDLQKAYNMDWMEYVSADKVKFLGEKGMYYVSYDIANDYIVIEPLYDVEKPNAMYLCGAGMGQPNYSNTITSGWGFDSPNQNFVGRQVSTGVYQFTVYMENEQSTDYAKYGTLNFKFFHQHGWGGEEDGGTYTQLGLAINGIDSSTGITKDGEKGDGSEGNEKGNWIASNEAFSGVYRITLDTNKKTTTFEKVR